MAVAKKQVQCRIVWLVPALVAPVPVEIDGEIQVRRLWPIGGAFWLERPCRRSRRPVVAHRFEDQRTLGLTRPLGVFVEPVGLVRTSVIRWCVVEAHARP